ncbi:MAG: DUF1648 domain-containing protein [Chloroflexi bacterium]|nr:DUF1648 domain-containing protein [Chloroflexota bacterium]
MSQRVPLDLPSPPPPEELLAPRDESVAEPGALALLVQDRALQILLASAFIVNLALLIYLALRYQVLLDPLPLHFDSAGLPDRIEPKSGIFGLPIIGAIVFGLNATLALLTHRWQRAAAILLAAITLLAQILMWLAMLNIVGGIY